ncbi:outer membrane protein [Rhodoplanes sp. Z2-YC6860]|uniref:outer membrane protein n=1 Tax=Rhodoplanes sp. Z2-YC6860 TaxID=674703 RepID=UPI00082A001B|nr:outer membrane beta-barrel protein [Rhodoplanes sp. Z2-YC6860]
MASLKVASFVSAVALFSTAAHTGARAADLPLPPLAPPPIEEYVASGWYLRGDIGMTNQNFKGLHQRLYDVPGTSVEAVGMGWDSSMLFGLGVGYKFNDWIRFDVTGEYRGKSNFHGSDNVTFNGGRGVDNYSGSKSEWVVLTNAYVDLGTWYNFTPYIGAGVGAANISITGFRDDGFNNLGTSTAYAADADKWNFAWALHAGITYKVTESMSIDFGYRYLDMGNATTGATRAFDGSFTNGGPFTFNHIYSHDLKLGIRWMLEPPMPAQPVMPLIRKG